MNVALPHKRARDATSPPHAPGLIQFRCSSSAQKTYPNPPAVSTLYPGHCRTDLVHSQPRLPDPAPAPAPRQRVCRLPLSHPCPSRQKNERPAPQGTPFCPGHLQSVLPPRSEPRSPSQARQRPPPPRTSKQTARPLGSETLLLCPPLAQEGGHLDAAARRRARCGPAPHARTLARAASRTLGRGGTCGDDESTRHRPAGCAGNWRWGSRGDC